MATEPQTPAWPPYPVEPWPPDDTRESISGTDLHQGAITNLRLGINGAARLSKRPEAPMPWQALTQELLLGCRRPDGSYVRAYPDVFVYPHALDPNRGSHMIEADGPPVLIVEVLSETTCEADLDLVRGKGYSYARAGVAEYLALDPSGLYLRERVRALRLHEGEYRAWAPGADGRHHSEVLPLAFAVAGATVEVYLADGRRMHQEHEVEEEIERLRRLLEER
jgi:Uma2 family endonuclease